MSKIHVSGRRLRNASGQEVILNGICLICRDPRKGYLEPDLAKVLAQFPAKGFNLIRLGIFWDGVEPAPGIYDEKYLDRIVEAVRLAASHSIYVMLDMHQDLFSAQFIDGAPAWATLDDGLPPPDKAGLWYEAYLSSPAVMRAADHFWANSPAADGIGLLDHYANLWAHLARRFQEEPNIIGFEPMNEPYMGSRAPQAFGAAIAAAQQINPSFSMANAATASAEEQQAMLAVMTEHFIRFDQDTLMPFYHRMLAAIRQHSDCPVIIGCNVYGTAVQTGLKRLSRPDGQDEPQQIFAPHGYDAVVDTDNYAAYNKDNVRRVFERHRLAQDKLNLPVIVGEWGNFPSGDFTGDLIELMSGILEQNLWHSTYHQYESGLLDDPHYNSLVRGYPQLIGGDLQAYHYDYECKRLTVQWQAAAGQETVLFHPDLTDVQASNIYTSHPVELSIQSIAGSSAGWIRIIAAQSEAIEVAVPKN